MELDLLIRKLQATRDLYPGSRVVIGTSSQVINQEITGMNGADRLPIADGASLGDQDGECSSLFIVTIS